MVLKRKKRGSSLIFVVIMFMFVLVVSGAMLFSMVVGNYTSRVTESNRVENLYGSESGLDIAYNVIAKTIENANQYGYNKVEDLKTAKDISYHEYKNLSDTTDKDKKSLYALYADIDFLELDEEKNSSKIKEDREKIDQLINYVFRKSFKEYINDNLKNNIQGKDSGSDTGLKGVYLENLTSKQIVNYGGAIITFDEDGLENDKLKWESDDDNKVEKTLTVKYGFDEDRKIVKKDTYALDFTYYGKEEAGFNLKSEFETSAENNNTVKVGTNKRTIKAFYSINIPNYDEVIFKNSVVEAPIKDIPQFIVGGDMEVNDSDLNVTGDIFVQGNGVNNLSDDNRTYKKYDSGIKINSTKATKSNINFNNNVYTRETFNIRNNINAEIKGNLYAKNLYAGDSENGNETSNSDLNINSNNNVVLDNDLAVKAKKTNIIINNFYGISDITDTDSEKVRKSSSIIINNYKQNDDDKCNINIKGEAYIAGVAHINTSDGYQTGESVAVKGNYNAYSVPVDKSIDYNYNDTFNTEESLQLLNGDLEQKSKHFYEYWKDKISGQNKVDCGGVIFDNIRNVRRIGAIVSENENKVYPANYTIEDFSNGLNDIRIDYASKVYKMGQEAGISDYNSTESVVKVDEYIGFGKITEYNKNKAIFSKDKPIVIIGNNSSGTDYDSDHYVIINVTSDPDLQAVIVCDKDVIIDGDVNLLGNIITNGNLMIRGNGKVNLYYDKKVTNKVQNSNKEIFREVFGIDYAGEELDNDNSLDNNINSNSAEFIKTKLWKIVK